MADVRLSKLMALILRHEPEKFGLTLDAEGYAALPELLDALRTRMPEVEEKDVRAVVAADTVKRRFSIEGAEIRANYGHSLAGKIPRERAEPPALLFHGTARDALSGILADGLRPMRRQYVHLTVDADLALKVGRRHGPPRLLKVDALRAHAQGVAFYPANPIFWLADLVPAEFLT